MNSAVKKRSVNIDGRKTSLSLEDDFWDQMLILVEKSKMTIGDYLLKLSKSKPSGQSLSSAVRCVILKEALK